jgi:hypothetical protein
LHYYESTREEYWAFKAVHLKPRHRGKILKKGTQPLGRIIKSYHVDKVDNFIEPVISPEDLMGDRKAISFKRMQKENGKDNSSWYFELEQRQAINFFKKHRKSWDFCDIESDLFKKGYVPRMDKEFKSFHNEFRYKDLDASQESLANAKLFLSLQKLGIGHIHPELHMTATQAKTEVLSAYVSNLGFFPMDEELKSPIFTEGSYKVYKYFYDEVGYIPDLGIEKDYSMLSFLLFGVVYESRLIEKYVYPHIDSVMSLEEMIDYCQPEPVIHKDEEASEPTEDLYNTQENSTTRRWISCKRPETVDEITRYKSGIFDDLYSEEIDINIDITMVRMLYANMGRTIPGDETEVESLVDEGGLGLFGDEDY